MTIPTLAAEASADQVLEHLHTIGACVVENRMSDDLLTRLLEETDPLVEQSSHGREEFAGLKTRRTGALIASSSACREVVQDALVLDVANAFLSPFCKRIQLMLTQIIAIGPGESDQLLHRDRLAWGGYLPRSIETQLNTMWALTDFTSDNGATRIVPGSADWPDEREPQAEEVVQAEMRRGSVLFFTGSVIHAGGGNHSGGVRMGLNVDYCLDWLRQEENQYLSCPPEIARTFPQSLTELIGYTGGGLALGYYSDPYDEGERAAQQAENAVGYEPTKEGIIL